MRSKKSGIRVRLTRADAVAIVRQIGLDPAVGFGCRLMEFWDALEAERLCRRPHKKPGQAANGYAGYGHVWRGKRGKRKRVKHEREQQVIAWIVKYRGEGYSWNELHSHLAENAVLTAKGKPWSVMRVRRAYHAAVKGGMVPAGPGDGRGGTATGKGPTSGTDPALADPGTPFWQKGS